MGSYYIIALDIIIVLMLFSRYYFRNNQLFNLFSIVSLYTISMGLPYILEFRNPEINIQGYIIKILVILLLYDKRMLLMVSHKKYLPFILILFILLISDIINLKYNVLYYFNYVLYFILILGVNLYNNNRGVLEKAMVNLAWFFGLVMTVVLVIKFSLVFTLNFREVRLSSIFGTADEEGAFYLMFLIIMFFSTKSKIIKSIISLVGLFLLVFAIGTKTSLLSLLIIVLIYYMKNVSVSSIIVLILLVVIFYEFMHIYIFMDIINVAESSNETNTLSSRVDGIWIPAFNYIIEQSPFFGFGNKGWIEVTSNSNMTGGYYNDEGYNRSSHNMLIFYLAEWGLLGVLILINFFYQLTKNIYKKIKINRKYNVFMFSVFLSWIALLISSMSSNIGTAGWIFISIFFGISISRDENFKKR